MNKTMGLQSNHESDLFETTSLKTSNAETYKFSCIDNAIEGTASFMAPSAEGGLFAVPNLTAGGLLSNSYGNYIVHQSSDGSIAWLNSPDNKGYLSSSYRKMRFKQ